MELMSIISLFRYTSDTPSPPIINTMEPALFSIATTWNISLDEGGSPVLDYRIILRDTNNRVLRNRSGKTETYYTIQNLKHNTTYILYIQARNVVGYGKTVNRTVLTLAAGKSLTHLIQSSSLSDIFDLQSKATLFIATMNLP